MKRVVRRQGFDFLGFHCRKVESWNRYRQRWPSRRAMQRVRDRVKAITAPRHHLPEPIEPIVAEVNQVLREWGAYFRVGNVSRKFQDVDHYERERLAEFLAKKAGRGGHQRRRYTWAFFE